MKLTGGSGEILRVALPFVSPRIYSSGVVFELILGLWLITGMARAWSWLIALLFFGLLGYMSFRLGWYGQASCGCFGKIAVNPWWAFAIDVGALVGLILFPPRHFRMGLREGLPIIVGSVVISVGLLCILSWRYGTLAAAMAHIQGETTVVHPSLVDIGAGFRGELRTVSIRLTNYADKSIRIVGGTTDCTCIATRELPVEIPPGASQTISVVVKLTGSVGLFHRTFVLFADDEKLKVMPVAVTGSVKESSRVIGTAN